MGLDVDDLVSRLEGLRSEGQPVFVRIQGSTRMGKSWLALAISTSYRRFQLPLVNYFTESDLTYANMIGTPPTPRINNFDDANVLFDSREWAKNKTKFIFYVAILRSVWLFLCQDISRLDKTFRELQSDVYIDCYIEKRGVADFDDYGRVYYAESDIDGQLLTEFRLQEYERKLVVLRDILG